MSERTIVISDHHLKVFAKVAAALLKATGLSENGLLTIGADLEWG